MEHCHQARVALENCDEFKVVLSTLWNCDQ